MIFQHLIHKKLMVNTVIPRPEYSKLPYISRKLKLKLRMHKFVYKSRKFVFALISEHCVSFGTKHSICPLLRGGGICMSLT